MPTHSTVVDAVVQSISRQILSGTITPGSRLPSVRALATEHGVNVSTIQRALTRLQERRLVRAHDRSGVEVCDVRRTGGASLWPLVLEQAQLEPAPAINLLRDALAIRRLLAREVLRNLAARPYDTYGAALRQATAALATEIATGTRSPERLLELDGEILRTMLVAAERPAILGIFNDVQSMITTSPVLVGSFYRDPAAVLQAWEALGQMLALGLADTAVIASIQSTLADIDETIVAAFTKALGAPPTRKTGS